MPEPLLLASGLRKEFGSAVAVDDVSFAVEAGASLAIVGESGSGKSTCARMVVGLERPTAGTIAVDGEPWSLGGRVSRRERLRRGRKVQMVFQDPYLSLDRRQTVRDCLAECLDLHVALDRDAREARIQQLLDQVGLDERQARALPRALSGGQRQRVAIARALAAEPRLLILDEAVAALDVSIQAQVLNVLADIRAATGIAFLFISHDLAVVRQVCDEVLVLHRGRVVEQGGVDAVLEAPRDPYTRRLIDSVPRPGWKPRRRRSSTPEPTPEIST
ncbi:MAG TPA: ATP-binding cassette domain-containing protein [Solirubrobacteraceae bacterium]|nr:ATP-binding cassette domain-containing protein [Solirubrobacteraceae bacterium]